MIDLRAPGELAQRLLVTDAWPAALANKTIDAMTFSGGVAEYLYKRETQKFGDLGFELAEALRHMLAHRRDLPPVWDPGQGIRATVIGAAQFSVQISGNTILIADRDKLPLQNLPVISCNFGLTGEPEVGGDRRAEVRRALDAVRPDRRREPGRPLLPLAWRSLARPPARGRRRHLHGAAAHHRGGDAAHSADRRRRGDVARPHHPPRSRADADVIAIDGVQLKQFDYVDIGERHRGDQRRADHHQVAAVQVTTA